MARRITASSRMIHNSSGSAFTRASWRRMRSFTRRSISSGLCRRRTVVMTARAYSSVCSSPCTTWASYTRSEAASASSPT